MSPTNSSGTSQVFEVSFSDPDGNADIRQIWLLFNPTLDARNACWVFYDGLARQFGLVNDAGTAEAGRVTAGQDARVENSQCTLYGSGSSTYTYYDGQFPARFSIAFKPAFAGLKNAYVFADDRAGQTIGWREMGQWIVPTENPLPRVLDVTSSSARGTSSTFTFRVYDPRGNQNVRQAGLLINSVLSGANACWISYDAATGRIVLVNNAGTGEAGQVTAGVVGVAENDQCAISGVGSSVTVNYDNSIAIAVPVRFKPAFDGIKSLYASVQNRAGQNSGWQFSGTHSVVTANLPPLILGASTSGGSRSTTLYASVNDPNGSADVRQAWVLVNTSISAAAGCWVFYDRPSNQMGLVNDAGNSEAGRITPGEAGSVENSQCTLSGTGSSTSVSYYGDQLNVAFSVTAKTSFRGLKSVFVNAIDLGGLTTGWQPLTSWNIP